MCVGIAAIPSNLGVDINQNLKDNTWEAHRQAPFTHKLMLAAIGGVFVLVVYGYKVSAALQCRRWSTERREEKGEEEERWSNALCVMKYSIRLSSS